VTLPLIEIHRPSRRLIAYTLKTTREILSIQLKLKCKIKHTYQDTLQLNFSLWPNWTRPDPPFPAIFLTRLDPTSGSGQESCNSVLTGRQQRHVDRGRDATFMSHACLLYDHQPPPVVEFDRFLPRYSWPDDRQISCISVPLNDLACPPYYEEAENPKSHVIVS